MSETYLMDDVYYCPCCGEFYDIKTHALVTVDLSTIPAVFALEVMNDRQAATRKPHGTVKIRRRPQRAKSKGFTGL